MWGEGADSAFHIDLILRHFRVYGIMMAGLSGFSLDENAPDFQEQLVSVNVLKNWLYSEFKLEEEESYINPMIFTYYYRDLYSNGQISRPHRLLFVHHFYDTPTSRLHKNEPLPSSVLLLSTEKE